MQCKMPMSCSSNDSSTCEHKVEVRSWEPLDACITFLNVINFIDVKKIHQEDMLLLLSSTPIVFGRTAFLLLR